MKFEAPGRSKSQIQVNENIPSFCQGYLTPYIEIELLTPHTLARANTSKHKFGIGRQ